MTSPSTSRQSPAAGSHALIAHPVAESIAAYRRGQPVTAGEFMHAVARTARALPDRGHVLNLCSDRYNFAVGLFAAILRGQTTLLPPTTVPSVIASMRSLAADAYFISDDASIAVDLPRFQLQLDESAPAGHFRVAEIAADQLVALVFTSGSTGDPQPHRKTWGSLVTDVRAEGRRLEIGPRHVILGTVPAQHMYGFESTVLLPLLCGAALTGERLYLPGEIDAAICSLPPPRVLFTTPFHLRSWLGSSDPAAIETLVSATAPLSVELAREAEARTGARLFEIFGCTEAGQIATRRSASTVEWELLDGLHMTEADGNAIVSGGHVEEPTPLQDAIDITGQGTRFVLHGRRADMVNVAGKRSSLAYLNHQLTSVPGVEDGVFLIPDEQASDGVTRLIAFAVAPGLTARDITAALRERMDAAFLPRRLHLVDALPRQHTGKLPREALCALAATELLRDAKAALPVANETSLAVPYDHPVFDGHFPGRPILPGVVLLDEALSSIAVATARAARDWRVDSAKFLSPVEPGTQLTITHFPQQSGSVRFEIRATDRVVATGIVSPRAS
ncbi:MAG: AMP-binding protein [Pseudomonadota bacterium]|nr:AMP-binding protein [Pseudomonadota bacterium]